MGRESWKQKQTKKKKKTTNNKKQTNNKSNTETKQKTVISFQSHRQFSLPETWSLGLAFGGGPSSAWKQSPYMGKNIKPILSPVSPGKSENAGVLDSKVKCPASFCKLLSAVFTQNCISADLYAPLYIAQFLY